MEKIKNYQVWDGKHQFWFKGAFITGLKPYGLLATFLLIQITNFLSLSFTWVVSITFTSSQSNLNRNVAPFLVGCILWLLVNIFLVKASLYDPGLIPKMDDYYEEHIIAHRTSFKNWLMADGLQGQKSHLTKLKYCATCMIFRPKRAVHC